MTPKEKAINIIANMQIKCKSLDHQDAKQCALIAVDNIIDSIKMIHKVFRTPTFANIRYFKLVQKEIEKL